MLPKFIWLLALLCCARAAIAAPNEFSFGVIAAPFQSSADEAALRKSIAETDADNLAFVVVNAIKSEREACSDNIYAQRKALFDQAKNGVIVSLAASDWSGCRNSKGRASAAERLNRVRELFFSNEFSLGASKIPLLRQSTSPRFRSYGENARWEGGNILFATVNFPANNNHYLAAAGRNSEFEDRQVANHDWLQHLFAYASLNKTQGIVLFSDGNPLALPASSVKRDGFLEARKHLTQLAAKYPGKVLLIHASTGATTTAPTILWQKNIGTLAVGAGWVKLNVSAAPQPFRISSGPTPRP